jgi:hypothetical protein
MVRQLVLLSMLLSLLLLLFLKLQPVTTRSLQLLHQHITFAKSIDPCFVSIASPQLPPAVAK